MTRTEAILIGFIAFLVVGGITLNTYMVNVCRAEGIKAGRNAEDINQACR